MTFDELYETYKQAAYRPRMARFSQFRINTLLEEKNAVKALKTRQDEYIDAIDAVIQHERTHVKLLMYATDDRIRASIDVGCALDRVMLDEQLKMVVKQYEPQN